MLQGEHSAILLTCIKLPFSFKTLVLSIFKWPLKTGFTVPQYFHVLGMYIIYLKCSKISYTFHFMYSNKMLVFRAGIQIMLVRIADREDPDQTASSEAGWVCIVCLGRFGWQLVFEIVELKPYILGLYIKW